MMQCHELVLIILLVKLEEIHQDVTVPDAAVGPVALGARISTAGRAFALGWATGGDRWAFGCFRVKLQVLGGQGRFLLCIKIHEVSETDHYLCRFLLMVGLLLLVTTSFRP